MHNALSLLIGWIIDFRFGDPPTLPHPIVGFGHLIAYGERNMNQGKHRRLKGTLLATGLVIGTFAITYYALALLSQLSIWLVVVVEAILIFFFLSGTTLIKEVRNVFLALDISLSKGRQQVARIVGRDTSNLTDNEVRKAALETLAENLSDGVIAPMFWLLIAGVPGMAAYKMTNTLDSMIGYKTERYKQFGTFAARLDDVLNYVPARLTALLMIAVSGRLSLLKFVAVNGKKHASPNSGYPESALAAILNCQFGGGHYYFGEYFNKPFIGDNDRQLNTLDMKKAIKINRQVEIIMLAICIIGMIIKQYVHI